MQAYAVLVEQCFAWSPDTSTRRKTVSGLNSATSFRLTGPSIGSRRICCREIAVFWRDGLVPSRWIGIAIRPGEVSLRVSSRRPERSILRFEISPCRLRGSMFPPDSPSTGPKSRSAKPASGDCKTPSGDLETADRGFGCVETDPARPSA